MGGAYAAQNNSSSLQHSAWDSNSVQSLMDAVTATPGNIADSRTSRPLLAQAVGKYSSPAESGYPSTTSDSVFYSIWAPFWFKKLPISTRYMDFKGVGATWPGFYAREPFGVDVNYRAIANNTMPEVIMYLPGNWNDRDTGTKLTGRIRVPSNFIVADVKPPQTPNNPATIINTSTNTALFLNAATRPYSGSALWAYTGSGNHSGSGLSGGEVSADELQRGVIPHAIAINVWGRKYLSPYSGGFVSPATKADYFYNNPASVDSYHGTNPNLRMGSRLAIPRGVPPERLGIRSKEGLAMYYALRDYGAYIVDNAGWDCLYVHGTPEASPLLSQRQTEIKTLFAALRITY